MTDGNFLGGFAQGFNAVDPFSPLEKKADFDRSVKLIEEQERVKTDKEARLQQLNQANTSINGILDIADKLTQRYQSGMFNGDKQQFAAQVNSFVDQALKTSQAWTLQGHAVTTPEEVEAKRNLFLSAIDPESALLNKTEEAKQLAQATAEGTNAAKTPSTKQVIDRVTGQPSFATEEQIQADPARYSPIQQKGTVINVGDKADSKLREERAKNIAAREKVLFDEVDLQASVAENTNNQLSFLLSSLDNLKTGKFTPLQTSIGGLLDAAGLDSDLVGISPDEIATSQAYTGAVNTIVLKRAESMKGNLSDKDVGFLTDSAPKLSNTVEGNKLLISYMQRMNDRSIMKQSQMDQWIEDNEGSLSGFNDAWKDYNKKNPLFTDADNKQIEAAQKGTLLEDKFSTVIDDNGDEKQVETWELVNGKLQRVKQ